MKTFNRPSSEKGVVIVISLILLLVMTTMGVGLVYSTSRNSKGEQGVVNRTESLHSAETCIQDLVRWLETEGKKKIPCGENFKKGTKCYVVEKISMGDKRYAIETYPKATSKYKERMKQHLNSCVVRPLFKDKEKDLGLGGGFDVGQGEAYGGGSTNTKYYYRLTAEGKGPKNSAGGYSSTTVEIIASMIF